MYPVFIKKFLRILSKINKSNLKRNNNKVKKLILHKLLETRKKKRNVVD